MEQLPKIVQRRLQGTAKPGVHPDPDLLAAFAEKSLNDRERSLLLQHLAECADCRDVVALAIPEIDASRAIAERGRSPWLSWPVLRWGALAACVVVVGAAVTLHFRRRQVEEPSIAEKAPAAPASVTAENKVRNNRRVRSWRQTFRRPRPSSRVGILGSQASWLSNAKRVEMPRRSRGQLRLNHADSTKIKRIES